jgi:hypothetical protein
MIARLARGREIPASWQKKGRSEDQPDQFNWERMPEKARPIWWNLAHAANAKTVDLVEHFAISYCASASFSFSFAQ